MTTTVLFGEAQLENVVACNVEEAGWRFVTAWEMRYPATPQASTSHVRHCSSHKLQPLKLQPASTEI